MNSPSKRPPLPDSWVERIFDRMQGLYGSLWLDLWRSGEMMEQGGRQFDRGLLLAKATWGQELAGFASQPERIHRALEACRHRRMPPTLPEFLDLCRQQHGNAPRALPSPAISAERVAEHVGAVTKRLSARVAGSTAWALTPPAAGKRGPWENAIIDLAEQGEPQFVRILAEHVERGVIVSARAAAVINGLTDDHAVAA